MTTTWTTRRRGGVIVAMAMAMAMAAGCGGAAATATPPRAGAGSASAAAPPPAPELSLERIERIARACAPDADLDWGSIGFARRPGGGSWRVRVDRGDHDYLDLIVDPAASTCDDRAVPSAPAAGDAGLDAVIELALRCHHGTLDRARVDVAYHRLVTGEIDRGRYEVFVPPAGATVFPVPQYLVDAAAGTCKPPDGPRL